MGGPFRAEWCTRKNRLPTSLWKIEVAMRKLSSGQSPSSCPEGPLRKKLMYVLGLCNGISRHLHSDGIIVTLPNEAIPESRYPASIPCQTLVDSTPLTMAIPKNTDIHACSAAETGTGALTDANPPISPPSNGHPIKLTPTIRTQDISSTSQSLSCKTLKLRSWPKEILSSQSLQT